FLLCLYPPSVTHIRCFILESYAGKRFLHSFPTRRSSDLASSKYSWPWRAMCSLRPVRSSPNRRSKTWAVLAASSGMTWMRRRVRSEEHTSELQSRFDLGCRVLLEKKIKEVFE